jgi:CubicO group peptidase (beta-lactamase class C family)
MLPVLNVHDLERRIDEAMTAAKVPGLSIAIVQGEEVAYARGFGVTNAEDDGPPVTPRTLFRIGSTTKPLTGTAVMRLVELGKLDLDRPVRDYVDWLRLADPSATERVTLRMLMSHTAGLATAAEHYGPRDPAGLATYVRDGLPSVPFVAPLARLWSYSNPGISLVGYVAEVAAGQPFLDLMRELVFEPLGMARTTFDPTVAMTYPLAQAHQPGDGGAPRVDHRFADNTGHYPAGFAISNVLDLARFAVLHMNAGRIDGAQLLRPESVAEMHRAHGRLYGPEDEAYGLTFGLGRYKGVPTVGHGGAISGYRSVFQMAPDRRVAVIALWSMPAGDGPIWKIVEGVFDRLLGLPAETPAPRAVAPNRALWPRYEGSYLGDWTGLATVRVADDRLVLDHNGERMPLEALADDLYVHRKTNEQGEPETRTIGFVAEPDGSVEYVRVGGTTARRIDLAGLPTPDTASLARWAGVYDWDGLDVVTLRVEDGRLFARSRRRDDREVEARPVGERRFATSFGTFEVEEVDDGAPRLRVAATFVYRRLADST